MKTLGNFLIRWAISVLGGWLKEGNAQKKTNAEINSRL